MKRIVFILLAVVTQALGADPWFISVVDPEPGAVVDKVVYVFRPAGASNWFALGETNRTPWRVRLPDSIVITGTTWEFAARWFNSVTNSPLSEIARWRAVATTNKLSPPTVPTIGK